MSVGVSRCREKLRETAVSLPFCLRLPIFGLIPTFYSLVACCLSLSLSLCAHTQSTVGTSGTGYLGQFSAQQPGKTVNAQQFALASGLAFRVRVRACVRVCEYVRVRVRAHVYVCV
jgi:hypothetical protein